VRLVISDAHEGIKKALATVLTGATWQRCRVHFMRNLLAVVPKGAREAVAAVVRTIFAQPDHASAGAQLRRVVEGLRPRFAEAAARLEEAAEDVLAHLHFPRPIAPDCTPPIRSSGSTRRSSAAPTSSGSSRRAERCCAWSGRSSPSRTTSGPWPTAATSARSRCGSFCSFCSRSPASSSRISSRRSHDRTRRTYSPLQPRNAGGGSHPTHGAMRVFAQDRSQPHPRTGRARWPMSTP
jgi:Transposase, Mutator family